MSDELDAKLAEIGKKLLASQGSIRIIRHGSVLEHTANGHAPIDDARYVAEHGKGPSNADTKVRE